MEVNPDVSRKINQLEERIRDLELQLRESGSTTWSGNWEMDFKNQQVTWSESMYHLVGMDTNVQPDMKLFKNMHPPSCLDKLNGAIRRIFMTGDDYSFEHYLKVGDDKLLDIKTELKLVRDENKKPIKLLGIAHDITSEKNARKELEKLSFIAAKTSNAVVMISIESQIEWVNSAFTMMTGYRPDEVQDQLFQVIFANEKDELSQKDQLYAELTSKPSISKETQIRTKQGKSLWALFNISPILDYELNPESYIAVITDITERKEAEKQLKMQRDEIANKNKEITDSIKYAKRILDAMLPDENEIVKQFREAFVIYQPKDIVSGDFYWIKVIDDTIYLAAVDCTGHGVPGAFVSLIGHRGLNRSVIEFGLSQPGEILDKLTELVMDNFSNSGKYEVRDGMDIALCAFNHSSGKLQYAGANNPLYCIRDGELTETKPDKQPIGLFEGRKNFCNHEFDLRKGDTFYIFSDGFADQFGGRDQASRQAGGKKFKSRQFKELLLSIQDQPLKTQKEIINDRFETWKGDLEQVDDICVIGIRV